MGALPAVQRTLRVRFRRGPLVEPHDAPGEPHGHQNEWLPKDKLTGHLLLDVLDPGDYYTQTKTAIFARWQFMYEF